MIDQSKILTRVSKVRYSILFIPLLFLATSCEKSLPSGDRDDFFHVEINGAALPVWVKGNTVSNKCILYINGGPGLTSLDVARADMFNWSEGLEENFMMVYYDQRGCGNSQGKFDSTSINIAQYVEDLDAIISVLNLKYSNPSIYLMGHSFGAFIGANYLLTADYQSKLAAWVSIDGAYNFDYDLTWQYRRDFLRNIANEEINAGNDTLHWQAALDWTSANQEILSRQQKNEWREFIGWPGEGIIPEELGNLSLHQYLAIGFYSSYNPVPAYASPNLEIVNDLLNADAEGRNLIGEVQRITCPSLMIWGKYDDLIPPEEGFVVFEHFGTPQQDKYFSILPNSSHEPYISDPAGFKNQIIDFVMKY